MTPEDLKAVKECLMANKVDILNTRAFKEEDGSITITVGSISSSSNKSFEHNGRKFTFRYGEFSEYLKETVFYLEKAL
jgi:hypothetical protein